MGPSELTSMWDALDPLLSRLGPLQGIVTAILAVLTAGGAIVFALGNGAIAPPVPAEDKKAVSILLGVCSGLILVLAYLNMTKGGDGADLKPWITRALLGGLVLFMGYWACLNALIVRCADDPQRHLKGLKLLPDAKAVLEGRMTGLPPERQIMVGPVPTTTRDYFCTSGKSAAFIWTENSIVAAKMLLLALYCLVTLSFVSGLAIAAVEMVRPKVEVSEKGPETTFTLSAMTLFGFDSDAIEEGATPYLADVAGEIRAGKGTAVTITGHTDAIGTPAYNQDLSERRAMAVETWLRTYGDLPGVSYTVSGQGSARPRYPEKTNAGRDRPLARQANRRVEITYTGEP